MNIIPISGMARLENSPLLEGKTSAAPGLPFQAYFEQALGHVQETQAVKSQDSVALALGEVDDLAAIQINAQKADLAVQMLVEMRNKVLDAYNEIMRINM